MLALPGDAGLGHVRDPRRRGVRRRARRARTSSARARSSASSRFSIPRPSASRACGRPTDVRAIAIPRERGARADRVGADARARDAARARAPARRRGRRPILSRRGRMAETKLIAENRRARHDYEFLERVEAGIALTGSEVKSARGGPRPARRGVRRHPRRRGVARRRVDRGVRAGRQVPATRPSATASSSCTGARSTRCTGRCARRASRSFPTRMYFKDGKVKVELALARGRERADKRRVDRRSRRAAPDGARAEATPLARTRYA